MLEDRLCEYVLRSNNSLLLHKQCLCERNVYETKLENLTVTYMSTGMVE